MGPGGRDVTAGAEVRTDMSWCNPVSVFVPGSPSLVTGHTVTMGQHMGPGDQRPGLIRIITQEQRSGALLPATGLSRN